MTTVSQIALLLAAEAGAEGGTNPLLRVVPGLWVWTLAVFLILLFVLYRYGWGVLIDKLDARDKAIRGAVDEARSEREEAERLLAEQKQLLDDARRKTSDMLAEAQSAAKSERQRILDEAREESQRIVERGRLQIEQETNNALSQIRGTVVDLALETTKKLVPEVVDPAAHRTLAEKFVEELDNQS